MTTVLIVDTETTGLLADEHKLIELAFISYHVESAGELSQFSTLLYASENPAVHINGITQMALNAVKDSAMSKSAAKAFQASEAGADFIMAHNAPFDRGFIHTHLCKTTKPWVDTKSDIKFPKQGSGKRLGYIAVDHGISVTDAHRALGDCRTLMRLFQQTPDLLEQLKALIGVKTYQALVSFDQKEDAKAAGFQWDIYGKIWKRKLSDAQAAAITKFKIKELPNG